MHRLSIVVLLCMVASTFLFAPDIAFSENSETPRTRELWAQAGPTSGVTGEDITGGITQLPQDTVTPGASYVQLLEMGYSHFYVGNYEAALEAFQLALAMASDDPSPNQENTKIMKDYMAICKMALGRHYEVSMTASYVKFKKFFFDRLKETYSDMVFPKPGEAGYEEFLAKLQEEIRTYNRWLTRGGAYPDTSSDGGSDGTSRPEDQTGGDDDDGAEVGD